MMIELNLVSLNKARDNLVWSIVEGMNSLEKLFMLSIMDNIDEGSRNGEKSHRIKISDLLQFSHQVDDYELSDDKTLFVKSSKTIEVLQLLGYGISIAVDLDEIAVIWGL